MQWAIYAAIVFSIITMAAFLLFLFLICTPTSATWLSLNVTYDQPYKCGDRRGADPLVGALSVFSDVYSLIIPQVVVSGMQLPWRQKLALNAIFSTGLVYVFFEVTTVVLSDTKQSCRRWSGKNDVSQPSFD